MEEVTTLPAVIEQNEITVEDASLCTAIELPSFKDTNDAKVLKNVRDVFRGFEFEPTGSVSKMFADTETLAAYIKNTEDDIRKNKFRAQATEIGVSGAAMARFWYMCDYVRRGIEDASYGTAVGPKLAAQLGRSQGLIYQYKHVAENLSVTDCYLLGLRGVKSTALRKLADIKDDDMRRGLVVAFIEAIKDTSDGKSIVDANKALSAALNSDTKAFDVIATSDPMSGGTDVPVTEEYKATMDQINKWSKALKKLAAPDMLVEFEDTLANFYMNDTIPDAAEHVQTVKDNAAKLRTTILAVKNNLDDAIVQIDSLVGVEVNEVDSEASVDEENS